MIRIVMPKAGQSMEEGTIRRWLKNEGEKVEKGEILLEIDTDKASVEVEAPENGILRKIIYGEGETVPVLAPIALLGEPGEDPALFAHEAEVIRSQRETSPEGALPAARVNPEPAPSPTFDQTQAEPVLAAPASSPPKAGEAHDTVRRPASPAARRIARDMGLDLRGVGSGSGPGGRILSTDLKPAASQSHAEKAAIHRPLSRMRRAIGRSLQASKQTIPHFYMRLTIDADPLYILYRNEKAKYSCTINDVITAACAKVLREFPAFRSRIENEEMIEAPSVNIGIAVAMEDGLVVPVIPHADRMSLSQLAASSRRAVEGARQGRLESVTGAVFTISNLGASGVEEFSAIINPPEAAILAVGAIRETVIVKDGYLRAGRVLTMTLSSDHRIIDGLMAARFLARLKEILETPSLLLN